MPELGKMLLAAATAVAIGVMQTPAMRAQSQTPARVEFEVASVKANYSGRAGYDGFQISHGSLTVKNVSVKMLIEAAYKVQASQVAGGPAWVNSDRFDIAARGAANATKQEVWLMLRALLADRFKLGLRTDTKELPIYWLEAGKNSSKLPKRDDAACEVASTPAPSSGPMVIPCGSVSMAWGPQGGFLVGPKVAMAQVANTLSGIVERPVVDRTGLTGTFTLQLQWTPEGYKPFTRAENEGGRPVNTEPGASIFTAVQEQLGLKLVAAKGPVEVLMVERAERPSEN